MTTLAADREIERLMTLHPKGFDLSLERISRLLERLGNPHEKLPPVIHIAEPGALIGFAGPRVIEQTIREKLPEGFQRAEYLMEHGMVDMVVSRLDMKATVARLLKILMHAPATPAPPSDAPSTPVPQSGASMPLAPAPAPAAGA